MERSQPECSAGEGRLTHDERSRRIIAPEEDRSVGETGVGWKDGLSDGCRAKCPMRKLTEGRQRLGDLGEGVGAFEEVGSSLGRHDGLSHRKVVGGVGVLSARDGQLRTQVNNRGLGTHGVKADDHVDLSGGNEKRLVRSDGAVEACQSVNSQRRSPRDE